MPETTLTPPPHTIPTVFTRDMLDWLPWLQPMAPEAMTERHLASLVDAARVKSPYFRLLARDPDVLEARTRTDKDIFYNPDAGLPRAERELATAIVSMVNGCVYCAAVHARRFAELTKQPEAMQRLFDAGLGAEAEPRRRAIIDLAALLTVAPGAVSAAALAPLRATGLEDLELLDLIHCIAMFANANRLMQSLGESILPG